MQISSLLTRCLDVSPLKKQPAAAEAADGPKPGESPNPTPNGAARALRDILAQHDVTAISSRQFSEMLHSLRQAGAVTEEQFQELSTLLADLNLKGIELDDEINLVKFSEKRLEESRDAEAGAAEIAVMERRLAWLQKSALIHAAPDAAGLDSLA